MLTPIARAQTPTPLFQFNVAGPAVAPFAAGTGGSGGSLDSYPSDTINVTAANSAPQAVYQTSRYGPSVSYTLTGLTPNAAYTLRLHFAERWHGIAGRGGSPGAGQRLMYITVNGTAALTNLDVYQQAGGADIALVKTLPAKASGSGQIVVAFSTVAGSPDPNAFVCGLEVLGVPPAAPAVPPAAPAGLVAVAGTSQVGLSWNAVSGATGYNVYRGTVSGGPYTKITTSPVTGATYTDTAVSAGTVAYYVVTAVSGGGESGPSNQAATPPAAPGNPTVTGAYGQNTLSWTPSIGATSYTIYRGTTPGGEGATPLATGVTSAPYVDLGLTNGQAYYYTIQANSGGGSGGGSGSSGSSGEGNAMPNASPSPGYYLAAYWGGAFTANGTYTEPYILGDGGPLEYGGYIEAEPGTVTVSGAITATLVYQPSSATDVPPASVVLEQDSEVSWAGGTTSTGSCDDGLGQSCPTAPGTAAETTVLASGTKYTVLTNPGSSITVTVSPTVTATTADPNDIIFAGIDYQVKTAPPPNLAIKLGGTTPDPDGTDKDIAVGQVCTASITGVPTGWTATSKYVWTVPDTGNAYQSWSQTTPANSQANPPVLANPNASSESDGPGPLTNPTASWYWSDSNVNATTGAPTPISETVSCIVTVTPPAGQGAAFPPKTLTANVKLFSPTAGGIVVAGTGRINNTNAALEALTPGYWLYAGSTMQGANDAGGAGFATVTEPAPFTGGKWAFLQLITPSAYSGTVKLDPNSGLAGLDTQFPYNGLTNADGTPGQYGDGPGWPLSSSISVISVDDALHLYVMYQPSGGNWVPLADLTWSFNADNIKQPTGGWSAYTPKDAAGTVSPAQVKFAPRTKYPSWTRINQGVRG